MRVAGGGRGSCVRTLDGTDGHLLIAGHGQQRLDHLVPAQALHIEGLDGINHLHTQAPHNKSRAQRDAGTNTPHHGDTARMNGTPPHLRGGLLPQFADADLDLAGQLWVKNGGLMHVPCKHRAHMGTGRAQPERATATSTSDILLRSWPHPTQRTLHTPNTLHPHTLVSLPVQSGTDH